MKIAEKLLSQCKYLINKIRTTRIVPCFIMKTDWVLSSWCSCNTIATKRMNNICKNKYRKMHDLLYRYPTQHPHIQTALLTSFPSRMRHATSPLLPSLSRLWQVDRVWVWKGRKDDEKVVNDGKLILNQKFRI